VVATFRRSVNDLLTLTPAQPGAVPILTRLEAFNPTKTADCSSITSDKRQPAVSVNVTLIAGLPGTWQSAATLIVTGKPREKEAA
jgi:hypothetical protein